MNTTTTPTNSTAQQNNEQYDMDDNVNNATSRRRDSQGRFVETDERRSNNAYADREVYEHEMKDAGKFKEMNRRLQNLEEKEHSNMFGYRWNYPQYPNPVWLSNARGSNNTSNYGNRSRYSSSMNRNNAMGMDYSMPYNYGENYPDEGAAAGLELKFMAQDIYNKIKKCISEEGMNMGHYANMGGGQYLNGGMPYGGFGGYGGNCGTDPLLWAVLFGGLGRNGWNDGGRDHCNEHNSLLFAKILDNHNDTGAIKALAQSLGCKVETLHEVLCDVKAKAAELHGKVDCVQGTLSEHGNKLNSISDKLCGNKYDIGMAIKDAENRDILMKHHIEHQVTREINRIDDKAEARHGEVQKEFCSVKSDIKDLRCDVKEGFANIIIREKDSKIEDLQFQLLQRDRKEDRRENEVMINNLGGQGANSQNSNNNNVIQLTEYVKALTNQFLTYQNNNASGNVNVNTGTQTQITNIEQTLSRLINSIQQAGIAV